LRGNKIANDQPAFALLETAVLEQHWKRSLDNPQRHAKERRQPSDAALAGIQNAGPVAFAENEYEQRLGFPAKCDPVRGVAHENPYVPFVCPTHQAPPVTRPKQARLPGASRAITTPSS
jgi:hypothetical protein